jgi:hypothetical protein
MKGRNMGIYHALCRSAIVIWIWTGFSALATVYQSDGSAASVQGLHNQVLNGDTITIPAGSFTWRTKVTISKSITLKGAGIGQSIIKDGVSGTQLIDVRLNANKLTRITGIEFRDGGRTQTANAPGGCIRIAGNNTDGSSFRMDHCTWNNLNGFLVTETVIGVIDHCKVLVGDRLIEWIYPYGTRWNGGDYGDGSWAAPANFGSSQFLFIEDCDIINSNTIYGAQIADGLNGARYVIRHCNLVAAFPGNHGTESGGRWRGNRAQEVYSNTLNGNNVTPYMGNSRGGTFLYHDNTITNAWGASARVTMTTQRMRWSFSPWNGANGTNPWDKNTPGGPFYTGTANSGGNLTVRVAGNPWTPNQWLGYSIKKNSGGFSYITGNSSNTISYQDGAGYGQNLSFNAGDAFQIYKVDQAIDQCGAGQSTLLSAATPTPPPGWNQAVEPCYIWNNTNDGQPFNRFAVDQLNVKQGVHYFNNKPMPGYMPYTYPHPLTQKR